MLRDVFYFGKKPNAHPRERHAANLEVARYLATTDHFWIINEFSDYTGFDWEFDFDTLPDDEVWTERHDNVWPSQHQKDSGTWLCNKNYTDVTYYRTDVEPVRRKNIKNDCWEIIHPINEGSFDFSWHPDPTEPPYIYRWGCKYFPATQGPVVQYTVPGATQFKYMDTLVDLVPDWSRWKILHDIELDSFDFCWAPDPASPPYIYVFGNQHYDAIKMPTVEYHMDGAEERKYVKAAIFTPKLKQHPERFEHLEDSYGIDYSWVPDPDSGPYIYAWGNQWNKPEDKISIQYAVQGATTYTYMGERAIRRPCKDNWEIPEGLDTTKFDFSWEPSPAEPPFIYQFGTQWQKTNGPRYVVKGATEIKYIDATVAKRLPSKYNWEIPDNIDVDSFDYSWHPDDTDPPFIYQFGTQHQKTNGPRYVVQGATEIKYIDSVKAKILPNKNNWEVPTDIDTTEFDYSWHPDDTETPYIYQFGTQHQKTNGPRYVVRGATEIKYVEGSKAKMLPDRSKFDMSNCANIDIENFDYSWHPDNTEVSYIYQFGTQHQKTGGPRYVVEGATEIKYVDNIKALALPDLSKYDTNTDTATDLSSFDFSWHPDTTEVPYIYQFGTQHQKTGGPRYIVPGATDIKYVDSIKAKAIVSVSNWQVDDNVPFDNLKFDFSWHPDSTEVPYIYQFGTQHQKTGGPRYVVPGATDISYVEGIKVTALPTSQRWDFSMSVAFDKSKFDFSWHPDDTDKEYIYVFGTQHQKTGGPRYVVQGATEFKYVEDQKAHATPTDKHWEVVVDYPLDFDYSWHPDNTEDKYIYVFGNQHYSAEKMPTVRYVIQGATEFKYINDVVATIRPDKSRFRIHTLIDENKFDYSWVPDPGNPPYVYVWGNKHVPAELGPTVEYYVDGAIGKNFVHNDVVVLPEMERWNIIDEIDKNKFDFTWRPDPTAPPYIYAWGSKHVDPRTSPAIEYIVPNATEYKFMSDTVEVLPKFENWFELQKIDRSKFDFTWRPNPKEPPFIYAWGNKHVPVEIKSTLEYRVPNATEYKYMDDVDVLPEWDRWVEHIPIDKELSKLSGFDFTWRPDPREPPYIYVWGNKYFPGELRPTLEYHCDGASQKKYMSELVELKPNWERWEIIQKPSNFDFSWTPDPREPPYIYVWGNKHIPGEKLPTLKYVVPGATEYKYMSNDVAVTPEWNKWKILVPVDKESFDFSWRPDPGEPPFVYVWGNQYNAAEVEPTIEYHCDGAYDQRKYMHNVTAKTLPESENWKILIPIEDFDFSWRPDPGSPPYIYVFGNQWNDAATEPTVQYHVQGATEYNYINDIVAKLSATKEYWRVLMPVENFDFSWRPNPYESPYIYVFGNQWNPVELEHTIEYRVPGATEYKYMHDIVAKLKSVPNDPKWKNLIPIEHFDYSWIPDPREPAFIYVFGNKWNDANTEPSVEYHMPGATERKYIQSLVATPIAEMKYWSITNNDDLDTFDFSWRPNPFSPPQIYQWEDNGPRYTVPDATEVVYMKRDTTEKVQRKDTPKYYITTTLEDLIKQHSDEVFWALNPDMNYDSFDFSWRPNSENFRHINVFGSEYAKDTQTYYINGPMYTLGYREYNYVEDVKVEATTTNLTMFYIDRGNVTSNKHFADLQKRYPNIIRTRYLNSWVDTINRCIRKSDTNLFWVLNSEYDYTDFKFNFYPSPWQMKMVHVFGTQWSHWGHTYLINGETFIEDTKYVRIIEHLNCLNFVKNQKAKATDCLYDIYLIDHGNFESSFIHSELVSKYDNVKVTLVPHRETYLETFKDILEQVEDKNENYIWITNSVCGYDDFEFSYICDPFAKEQLHVFPSDKQKYGDTFLVNVDRLREQVEKMISLDDYDKINFNMHQSTNRLEAPEIVVEEDTHTEIIQKLDFEFPYVILKTRDNNDVRVKDDEPISLWSKRSRTITVTTSGASRIIVPKEAKKYVKNELYDYPHIEEKIKKQSKPLDIVFLSNGETNADENYEHLLKITKGLPNRVVRVDGVNGRVQAYHAAAEASNTNWLFTVFAKLKVDRDFDFSWQPDRLRKPKHYIFQAKNTLNGLVYGHQAMIAYNKKLTLANTGKGLDFTLDDLHDSVEILSGVAEFNTDAYSTWRTAFREVIKLKSDYEPVSADRLKIWLSTANGNFAEDCLRGARDAINYYNEVNGDIDQLKLSYEWSWLKEFYNKKYK